MTLEVQGNGANRTLLARLTDTTGDGVAGKRVDFFADGNELGSAWTDEEGRASFSPARPYHAGKRSYRAEFAGDEWHEGSSAETTT